jgi:hypothetical protein
MKRSFEESLDNFYYDMDNDTKKFKNQQDNVELLNCGMCDTSFSSSLNLKQHIESYHMKTSIWICSDCKKSFTSKSNLKVHLRVHTRIKPYHCKSCNYSCMHHSSIKEHLAKIHPNVIHSTSNPAYVFNSIAVPDPEQFNSTDFNKEAFIAEAKMANEKLVAQIYHQPSSMHPNSSSVNVSPISNISSLNSTRNDLNNQEDDDEEIDVGINHNFSSTSSSDIMNDEACMNLSKQSSHENSFKIKANKDKSKLKRNKQKYTMDDSLDSSSITNNNCSQISKGNLSFSINSIMNGNTSSSPKNIVSPINTQTIQNYADLIKKLYPTNQYLNNMYNVQSNYSVNSTTLSPTSTTSTAALVTNMWPYNNYNMFYNILNQFKNSQNLM